MTKEEILNQYNENTEYPNWYHESEILIAMERYVNQERRDLEAKILSFRQKFRVDPWKNKPSYLDNQMLKIIDEHFGISEAKTGKL